ncbi:MAG: V8-like Glu-specific endopeptidase [Alphaproteobacteria bacterium]|jgi:V8-like Glu-specific endopeptidase
MPNNNINDLNEEDGLFPPMPEVLEHAMAKIPENAAPQDMYRGMLESMCGAMDDSQAVEQYDGSLGVSKAFVKAHQSMGGQLQCNNNLADKFTKHGNVSGAKWCSGTMISDNLFLTAGHCFDQTGGSWQRPKVNGSNEVISPAEIAKNMHVNFNYQVDASGTPQAVSEFAVQEIIEYRLGGLDYAILRLAGAPGRTFGVGEIATRDAKLQDMLCIIGHTAGVPKRIEAGPLTRFDSNRLRYNDIDTLGGNSGSAVWQSPSGNIVGVHTNGGCNAPGGSNSGMRISRLLEESPILQSLGLPALQGRFTIWQKSNNRFMDAHRGSNNDFSAVTRNAQNNDTQRRVLSPVGQVCTNQWRSLC